MNYKLTKQEWTEFINFFVRTATETLEAIPLPFTVPVRLAHVPINVEKVLGPDHRVFGILYCEGKTASHIELDFRFVFECWLKRLEDGSERLAIVLCHELAHVVVRNHNTSHQMLFHFYALSAMIKLKNPTCLSDIEKILLITIENVQKYASGGEIFLSNSALLAQFYNQIGSNAARLEIAPANQDNLEQ